MTTTKRTKKQPTTYNGSAIPLTPTTDLGLAMLIAEDEEGHYEPIAVVGSIAEGKEIAASNMRAKEDRLGQDADPGICPYEYKVMARGVDGDYILAASFPAHTL